MNYTALLDANVLYPAPLRDLLLQLTVATSPTGIEPGWNERGI